MPDCLLQKGSLTVCMQLINADTPSSSAAATLWQKQVHKVIWF